MATSLTQDHTRCPHHLLTLLQYIQNFFCVFSSVSGTSQLTLLIRNKSWAPPMSPCCKPQQGSSVQALPPGAHTRQRTEGEHLSSARPEEVTSSQVVTLAPHILRTTESKHIGGLRGMTQTLTDQRATPQQKIHRPTSALSLWATNFRPCPPATYLLLMACNTMSLRLLHTCQTWLKW